jgi:hypothetical protein
LIALIFSPVLLLFEDGNEVGELLFLDYEPEHRESADGRDRYASDDDARDRAVRKRSFNGNAVLAFKRAVRRGRRTVARS